MKKNLKHCKVESRRTFTSLLARAIARGLVRSSIETASDTLVIRYTSPYGDILTTIYNPDTGFTSHRDIENLRKLFKGRVRV